MFCEMQFAPANNEDYGILTSCYNNLRHNNKGEKEHHKIQMRDYMVEADDDVESNPIHTIHSNVHTMHPNGWTDVGLVLCYSLVLHASCS